MPKEDLRSKFYYKAGQESFDIVYQNEDYAMKDFNNLMKSLEKNRLLWHSSRSALQNGQKMVER